VTCDFISINLWKNLLRKPKPLYNSFSNKKCYNHAQQFFKKKKTYGLKFDLLRIIKYNSQKKLSLITCLKKFLDDTILYAFYMIMLIFLDKIGN
jgi:hypothetical protein